MPRCAKCGKEYELYDLYCNLSGRGANSTCESHGYSDLYCINCAKKLDFLYQNKKTQSIIIILLNWLKQEINWRFLGKKYTVKLSDTAKETIDNLPLDVQEEINKKIEEISRNPYNSELFYVQYKLLQYFMYAAILASSLFLGYYLYLMYLRFSNNEVIFIHLASKLYSLKNMIK